jgi:hypothetical protein
LHFRRPAACILPSSELFLFLANPESRIMKKTILALSIPLFCFAAAAQAADNDAPKTRAEVKQETRAATAMPAKRSSETGAVDAVESKVAVGEKSRQDVKAETRAAVRSGDLPKTGEAVAAEAGDQHNAPKKKMKHKMHRHHRAGTTNGNASGTPSMPSSTTTPGTSDTMGK